MIPFLESVALKSRFRCFFGAVSGATRNMEQRRWVLMMAVLEVLDFVSVSTTTLHVLSLPLNAMDG